MRTAGSQILPTLGKGTVSLTIDFEGRRTSIFIDDVLHVPTLSKSLLSARQLSQAGYFPNFENPDQALVIEKSTERVAFVVPYVASEGLYQISIHHPSPVAFTSTSAGKIHLTMSQLHECLGHANFRLIREMYVRGALTQFKIKGPLTRQPCAACSKSKSTVLPHATKASRPANFPGHIVSADIIDGRSTNAHGSFKFASVIVDQFSDWTSVYVLKDKTADSILNHIKMFNAALMRHTGRSIVTFRSDRGSEYNNASLQQYAYDNHICLELAVAREPRDNGFAERRGRTLIKDTRTLLASANMHYSYWPYVMEYACHIQNRY